MVAKLTVMKYYSYLFLCVISMLASCAGGNGKSSDNSNDSTEYCCAEADICAEMEHDFILNKTSHEVTSAHKKFINTAVTQIKHTSELDSMFTFAKERYISDSNGIKYCLKFYTTDDPDWVDGSAYFALTICSDGVTDKNWKAGKSCKYITTIVDQDGWLDNYFVQDLLKEKSNTDVNMCGDYMLIHGNCGSYLFLTCPCFDVNPSKLFIVFLDGGQAELCYNRCAMIEGVYNHAIKFISSYKADEDDRKRGLDTFIPVYKYMIFGHDTNSGVKRDYLYIDDKAPSINTDSGSRS